MSADAMKVPRGADGHAPDVFRKGGWVPMREHDLDQEVDFLIVGTGAGGATLACRLAEQGFSVVALDAGAWWRPLEEFASDEAHQQQLYWNDERICDGDNPLKMGSNNSGKAVGGSTVHFAMVSLRFRPEWFKCRSMLGYGADWPVDWREMWHYYDEVEQALSIAGPVNYPWGPPRKRYPYRSHELNAAALVLARNVVVAGYAIETPRLLLISANQRFPDGLANSSGLVGKNLMVQSNQAVWGVLDEEVRSYKGPPSLSISEHWNYQDKDKDFFGGYAYMSQGPLPAGWASALNGRGLWGVNLSREMQKYNHQAGLKIVGETLPQERNRVTLADEKDQYGLPITRITYSFCDNDKKLIAHSLNFMEQALEAAGGKEIWREQDDTCHLNGTARMGDDPKTSVVNADGRSWDIPNLWICDGSVFPTVGGVNPSLTIQALACRTAHRIGVLASRGEL
ncbi:MAG: GMC family oxidoreductase [Rhodanobacter sp.]|nr:MAG: GMC family oxidoreductase [Rhodanobacter sp.]TAL88988.1 MAG: GMC family oxidoreductase [Rhodanobacter sp.]TAM40400.1 MAG: GMC family oxidoreductase [Rhodanobacter sp.]TAN23225.1 MAG: GMC family oxidoreductase [Rhodanobacter sp.]